MTHMHTVDQRTHVIAELSNTHKPTENVKHLWSQVTRDNSKSLLILLPEVGLRRTWKRRPQVLESLSLDRDTDLKRQEETRQSGGLCPDGTEVSIF
jgi:hypothetical protein